MDSVKQCCRLCLTSSLEKYDSIADSAIRSKLDVVFKFELPFEDILPAAVCPECSAKVDEFYSFHETVRTNQKELKTLSVSDVLEVELKGEPDDAEGVDPGTSVAVVDQSKEDENDADMDGPSSGKSDLDEPEEDVGRKKKFQKKKAERTMENSLTIERFFNGIPCGLCSVVSQTFKQFKAHGRKVHGKDASVKCCKREYSKQSKLVDHLNTSHLNLKQFFCEPCKKSFVSKYTLDMHNMKIHNPDGLRYQCPKCSQKFAKENFLKNHLKSHVRQQCTVCGRSMANAWSLKLHMQTHSEEQRSVPAHICDLCGKSYQSKQPLERHIKVVHLGQKESERIQCPQCDEWFSSNYLRTHLKIAHSGRDQQVTCPICHQVYANYRSLNFHKINVHTDRKLECKICGKTFKKTKSLKEHSAAHMGQRLYSCAVCGYSSNSNGNLYGHMKNKHPNEWAHMKATGGSMLVRHTEPMGEEVE